MVVPISSYAPGAAAIGGAAGAASGGLLGQIGRFLEPLDYPRRAAWNLAGGLAGGDWRKALPGVVGVGAGLAATPFLGPGIGIGIGSLAGGLAQGAMQGLAPESAAAPTPGELVQALGGPEDNVLLNMGVGMALDPLTYAGGLGGAAKGWQLGKGLEQAAVKQGLGYSDDVGKLAKGLTTDGVEYMRDWGWLSPAERGNLSRVAAEIPEGSTFLGHGAEAFVYRRPDAGIVRITRPGTPSSPIAAPEMLQPARDVAIGPYQVSHVPEVQSLGIARKTSGIDHLFGPGGVEYGSPEIIRRGLETPEGLRKLQPALDDYANLERQYERAAMAVGGSSEARGHFPWDVFGNPENVSRTAEGNWLAHDAGAIALGKGEAPPFTGLVPEEASGTTGWLLRMLGSKQALRDDVARRVASTAGQGIRVPNL